MRSRRHITPHTQLTRSFICGPLTNESDSIRRVRCDQTRPNCKKCSSTGRTCDGYTQPAKNQSDSRTAASSTQLAPRKTTTLAIARPFAHGQGSQSTNDVRHLLHYQTHAAQDLAGDFHDDFWHTIALQIGHREPCVRYMTLALSCLHHHLNPNISPRPGPSITLGHGHGQEVNLQDRALGYYSFAIRELNAHIVSKGWVSLEVTLASSILCIYFEWFQENHFAALTHLRSSLEIIRQWNDNSKTKTTRRNLSATSTSLSSPAGHLIRSTLCPMFTKLVLQSTSIYRDRTLALPDILSSVDVSTPFSSLREARDNLCDILGQEYLGKGSPGPSYKPSGPPRSQRRASFKTRLARWSERSEVILTKCVVPGQEPPVPAITLLLWRKIVNIMAANRVLQDELAFDAFVGVFEEILDLTNRLSSMPTSTFTADMSVVAVLFFVAAKCRHPVLRRRAISMLEAAPRREGIWDSVKAASTARQIMEVEEEAMPWEILSEADVSLSARVHGLRYDVSNIDCEWGLKHIVAGE